MRRCGGGAVGWIGRPALGVVLSAMLGVPLVASVPAGAAPSAPDVVTGLAMPAMFTVAADGRIFYSELSTGRIGVFDPADGSNTTYFQVPDLCAQGDQGLYGLAVHPGYPQVGTLFAYATRRQGDGSCANQVLRIDRSPAGAFTLSVLMSDPYRSSHIGGRLLFGPDGDLYVSTGDGADSAPTLAESMARRADTQDVNSLKGKVLRMTPGGTAPADNPFGNLVFAYGFRNVFGFDFDPINGRLWATDNGPDPSDYTGAPAGPGPLGGCNDELDRVVNGANYGWGPTGSCAKPPEAPLNSNRDGPGVVLPGLDIEVSTGITGARFCWRCGLGPAFEGRLFWVKYSYSDGAGEIHAATLSADRSTVVSDTLVYRPPGSSPLSIERGPDGTLYFSDSAGIHRLVDPGAIRASAVADFNGDATTDVSVFRPASNTWFVQGGLTTNFGSSSGGDVPVPADYNGDGITDVAVYNNNTGVWSISGQGAVAWGATGDIPVPADYDGDGKVDIAVFRPSTGTWFVRGTSAGTIIVGWGVSSDVPVPGDYDGDGKADIAVYRPSTGVWYIRGSTAGTIAVGWGGNAGDIPVPGDYDGDGKMDLTIYRPPVGTWYIRGSAGTTRFVTWGVPGDIPQPGDYDGDGKADIAVWRPSTGTWYVNGTTGVTRFVTWGIPGDVPLPLPDAIRRTLL